METRIPLDQFADYARCILVGTSGSIRWAACMEACDQEINRRQAERKKEKESFPDWRETYVVGFRKPRYVECLPDPAALMLALAGR